MIISREPKSNFCDIFRLECMSYSSPSRYDLKRHDSYKRESAGVDNL